MNCHRNYPWYRGWYNDLSRRGLRIIGIHAPETNAERNVESLEKRVREAEFKFPVLIDNEKKNWNSWGNSMWPAVYVIDRTGRIRYWWYGELKWGGLDGEKMMRDKIVQLLAEDVTPTR